MIERPRGTRDFSPEEMAKRRWAEERLRQVAFSYGYREIATPIIENLELFVAKSGPRIVEETYAFKDKGGRDLCLRPELTLPTMRYFATELRAWPRPVKVFYYGPVWRYEEPQKGRYREFWQFGIELIGADTPEADAEVIAVAHDGIRGLWIEGAELRVGHIGIVRALVAAAGLNEAARLAIFPLIDKKDFAALEQRLQGAGVSPGLVGKILALARFRGARDDLPAVARDLDSVPGAKAAVERLCAVLDALALRGIKNPTIDLAVVRGLDYYSGVVFEFHSDRLGAESQVGGGGAYGLTEIFGLPPEGTVGFGLGFDRLLLLADDKAAADAGNLDAFIVPFGNNPHALTIAANAEDLMRRQGVRVERELLGRSLAKSLKYAASRGAKFALLVGEKEAGEGKLTLRNLDSGDQTLGTPEQAASTVLEAVAKGK